MEKLHIQIKKHLVNDVGLSEKEALIYLSCLSLGGGTISEIGNSADIERTGIYYHLDSLVSQNFLKTAVRGRRTVYLASDPEKLQDIQNKRQANFEKIMPDLRRIFEKNSGKSVFEYFQGLEEADLFYNRVYEILKEMKPPENTIYCFGNSYKTISSIHRKLLKFTPPKEQIDIVVKCILPKSQKIGDPKKNTSDPYIVTRYNLPPAELKYIADKYRYPGSVVIAGDKIILYDTSNFFFSITQNAVSAATWKMLFNYIWDDLK